MKTPAKANLPAALPPARLFRISIYKSLEGLGGLYASGRWHTLGRPIVYLADSAASALLETLVHLKQEPLPEDYQLLDIRVPRSCMCEVLTTPGVDWRARVQDTRAAGDEWLRSSRTALARVPSALAAKSFNYLLNPAHPEARRVKIVGASMHPHDPRLLHGQRRS